LRMRAHKVDQPLKIRCHRFLASQAPWSALNNSALRVAVPSEGGMRDFDPAKCVADFLHAALSFQKVLSKRGSGYCWQVLLLRHCENLLLGQPA
jgi:hypothetical protein